METIKQLFIKYKEIIMYLIMGGGTTVVNWVAYSHYGYVLPSRATI